MKLNRNFLFLAGLVCWAVGACSYAAVPGISPDKYLKTYILGEEEIPVYTSKEMTVQGTAKPYREYDSGIYTSDEIRVYEIRDDWAYVSYPTFWAGWREGYIPVSAITSRNFSKDGQRCGGILKHIHKRPTGAEHYTASSIWQNDLIYTVAKEGDFVQIIYPVTSGYKMAWITALDYSNYIANRPVGPDNGTGEAKERVRLQLEVPYLSTEVLVRTDGVGRAPDIEHDDKCLFAAVAMKYAYHKQIDITPAALQKESFMRYVELFPEGMKELGYEYLNYYSPMQNSTFNQICISLSYDKPVIVGAEGSRGEHWVIVTGYDGVPTGEFSANEFSIHDPEDGNKKTLDQFLAGKTRITKIVF